MKGENNICINATTFEITEIENSFIVSKKLGKTISILNKKEALRIHFQVPHHLSYS